MQNTKSRRYWKTGSSWSQISQLHLKKKPTDTLKDYSKATRLDCNYEKREVAISVILYPITCYLKSLMIQSDMSWLWELADKEQQNDRIQPRINIEGLQIYNKCLNYLITQKIQNQFMWICCYLEMIYLHSICLPSSDNRNKQAEWSRNHGKGESDDTISPYLHIYTWKRDLCLLAFCSHFLMSSLAHTCTLLLLLLLWFCSDVFFLLLQKPLFFIINLKKKKHVWRKKDTLPKLRSQLLVLFT
jgi:hypothetical protein